MKSDRFLFNYLSKFSFTFDYLCVLMPCNAFSLPLGGAILQLSTVIFSVPKDSMFSNAYLLLFSMYVVDC